jgi:hypothetical protein
VTKLKKSTAHPLNITHHPSRFTFHASRFTFHVSRFTLHTPRSTLYLLLLFFLAACTPTATPAGQEELTIDNCPLDNCSPPDADFVVEVDLTRDTHPISPYIYGVSGAPAEYVQSLGATLNSWGGNPSTRYNWRLGNAWNAGSDFFYSNVDYSEGQSGSASDSFVSSTLAAGADVRLALPTLGWVAKDNDLTSCSFPLSNGECGDALGANCRQSGKPADPTLTSVPSTTADITAWINHLLEQGFDLRFLAMDNEPDIWGYTHYDVHPHCTTYQEMLDKYLEYASAVRPLVPDAHLTGPVVCCWETYWNSPSGAADKALHDNQDFLGWFLQQVRLHDEEHGIRHLDVLDIHYYPEGVFNDHVDAATAAQRLRSTRSLWDASYLDESWIWVPITLIPRMHQLIEAYYPGTRFGISEWNWGADETMNGALAIADVLGIYGRYDVYFANYWRYPPSGSPGYRAFQMYTNYDGEGGRFGDTSVHTTSDDINTIGSYAALDSATGNLHLLLINKEPEETINLQVRLTGFTAQPEATQYRYDQTNLDDILTSPVTAGPNWFDTTLPPYSITLLILEPSTPNP